jgi:hypothetical protein
MTRASQAFPAGPPDGHTSNAALTSAEASAEAASGLLPAVGAASASPLPLPPTTFHKQAMNAFSTVKKAASKVQSVLEIGVLLACWYASNILYNIYNKQVCDE